jgi:hypothetical protein
MCLLEYSVSDSPRLLQIIYLLEWRLCSAQDRIAALERQFAALYEDNRNLRYKAEDLEDALKAQQGEEV